MLHAHSVYVFAELGLLVDILHVACLQNQCYYWRQNTTDKFFALNATKSIW